jgi:ATP/maltotriose-dependent transcriptional regulator MalT
VREAIDHATAAGDLEDAIELIAGHWDAWFNSGRLATVEAWQDHLPMLAQLATPRLCAVGLAAARRGTSG